MGERDGAKKKMKKKKEKDKNNLSSVDNLAFRSAATPAGALTDPRDLVLEPRAPGCG